MFSKNTLITSLLAVALCSVSACSATQTQDAQNQAVSQQKQAVPPIPQMPVLPSLEEMAQKEIDSNRQYVESQIVKKDGKTKYFFDKDGKLVQKKAAGGYYRLVLGTTAAGNCAVQDFFADSNTKQSEPLIVAKKDCNNLTAGANDGVVITYDKKQQVDGVVHFKNGKVLNNASRDDNGIVLYADLADEPKNTIIEKVDSHGAMNTYVFNNNEIQEFTFFASDKTTPEVDFPTVTRLHYVNGTLNPANSYVYGNDANLSFDKLDQKTIDKFSKNANGRILHMKKILQALKK